MTRRTRNQSQPGETKDVSRALRPSRSEKKRQAERLTRLGVKLTELSPGTLAGLEMDDELREAAPHFTDQYPLLIWMMGHFGH